MKQGFRWIIMIHDRRLQFTLRKLQKQAHKSADSDYPTPRINKKHVKDVKSSLGDWFIKP